MRVRSLFFAALMLLVQCNDDDGRRDRLDEPVSGAAAPPEPLRFAVDATKPGIVIELSEVAAPVTAGESVPLAAVTALTIGQANKLLARLPALEGRDDDRLPFAKRADSVPPPRTGADVQLPFPPPAASDAPAVADAPPILLRYAPEGAVGIAPHLSLTFSQPMVAISSHDEASKVRPVQISPEPPGTWRWIGTKTLLFEPDPRFPMATDFRVEVPASVQSAAGLSIDKGTSWTFSTPPVGVVEARPVGGQQPLNPTIFFAFDQAIPADFIESVGLRGAGADVALRPLTEAERDAEAWVRDAIKRVGQNRSIALRPVAPLKAGTNYQTTVKRGAQSAEGPRLTTVDQSYSFRTYDPMALVRQWCDYSKDRCSTTGTMSLWFNNLIDDAVFDAGLVSVSPSVERLRVRAQGQSVVVSGALVAGQKYTVTVAPGLKDSFGQSSLKASKATFTVVHADPTVHPPPREMMTLDPAAPPSFSVFTTNQRRFRLAVYPVKPADFDAVSRWMSDHRYDGDSSRPLPLKSASNQLINVAGYAQDELVETPVDLTPWLSDTGFGHVLLHLQPETQSKDRWMRVDHFVWVQRTAIGLTAIIDQDEIVGWATSLADGKPASDVTLHLLGQPGESRTSADGTARLAKYPESNGPHGLVAKRGDDVALLTERDGWWQRHGAWATSEPSDSVAWFVYDDRGMYKPGETVVVKGWLRRYNNAPGGGVAGASGLASTLTWRLFDAQNAKLGEGTATVSATGGFDLAAMLPTTPNLGEARLDLVLDKGALVSSQSHHFQIQEFRRPEYEVTTSVDPRPYYLGEHARVTVNAAYYSGGALPSAPTTWQVTATPAWFSPPGWSKYRFGHEGGQLWGGWHRGSLGGGAVSGDSVSNLAGQTDAAGEHTLRVDFVSVYPPRPYNVAAQATVVDVNRQRWTSAQTVLVHPASVYVGVATDKGFYESGDEITASFVVADVDGKLTSGAAISVALGRLEWNRSGGQWRQEEVDVVTCDVKSAEEDAACKFTPDQGGSYRLTAKIVDAEGRPNQTTTTLWVTGGLNKEPPRRQVDMQAVTIVPDAASYAPGETAKLFVQAPFSPAEGLLTVGRNGIVETRRFALPDGHTVLELPITGASIPNLEVRVDVVGSEPRQDDDGNVLADKARRVAYASGVVSLSVPPTERALAVTVTPRAASIDPGGTTELSVTVHDANGSPVQGEVALVVVDESVLALANYQTPDPLSVFYRTKGGGYDDRHSRRDVVLADPNQTLLAGQEGALNEASILGGVIGSDGDGAMFGSGGLGAQGTGSGGAGLPNEPVAKPKQRPEERVRSASAMAPPPPPAAAPGGSLTGSASGPPIAMREDFAALALFLPAVRVNLDGRATVPLKLPDSLTRYRIMAVAVADAGERFGVGESSITARKPVMLRPSPPRFLNFGDRAELPLVVQNQTNAPLDVQLALRVDNARVLERVDRPASVSDVVTVAGRKLTIPANDRREVRVPIAADMAGRARFQAVIVSGGHTDAASFDFPVWTPATSEAFATYGEVDAGAIRQPVRAPPDVWSQFGGLEVTTSSTALSALTDAVIYLVQYPFDCTEQLASRTLAVVALKDVLGAFGSSQLPTVSELQAGVNEDLDRLRKRQNPNGGFSYWPGMRDEPYLSVHTAHALARAQAAGFTVDSSMLYQARRYLQAIERHIPSTYSLASRQTIVAYSLHVRRQLDDNDVAKASELMRAAGVKLPLEAQGWIAPVLAEGGRTAEVDTLVKHWGSVVSETAAGAQFTTSYQDTGDFVLLHSNRRTDAVLLESLILVQPEHDLVPKVVRALLGHRKAGRWSSTQENAIVLLALDRYFRAYESVTPDFVARTWLGDRYAGEHTFKGRTTERANIDVPMAWLTDPGGQQDLILTKDGEGRMYYRVGMSYAPRSLRLEPADHGFAVERVYEAVDAPDDVRRDPDGTWRVKAGARVRVRLTMVAPARRTHVALVDPMPGGFEPLNPALATTGSLPVDSSATSSLGRYWWWTRTWYEHQNLRDERAEAFTSLLWAGVHRYSYLATATTPGHFVVPPAKAEEMYHPETFGRSGSESMIIE